ISRNPSPELLRNSTSPTQLGFTRVGHQYLSKSDKSDFDGRGEVRGARKIFSSADRRRYWGRGAASGYHENARSRRPAPCAPLPVPGSPSARSGRPSAPPPVRPARLRLRQSASLDPFDPSVTPLSPHCTPAAPARNRLERGEMAQSKGF